MRGKAWSITFRAQFGNDLAQGLLLVEDLVANR